MKHLDHRAGLIIVLPLALVFLAGLAAGVAAIFLICNLPLMKRTWDQGRTMSFALSAALSLSLAVLIGSALCGLLLKLGLFGEDVYVPESFPLFLLRPAVEFLVAMLVSLTFAMFAFGAVRRSSELAQRLVTPGVFIITFVVALSLTKAWSSYWVLSDSFDADHFAGTLYQMIHGEFAAIGAAFAQLGDGLATRETGLFARLFQAIGAAIDGLWRSVRNAGGNQFVLVESYPLIFTVFSLLALVYMVLRWPFTALAHAKDDT